MWPFLFLECDHDVVGCDIKVGVSNACESICATESERHEEDLCRGKDNVDRIMVGWLGDICEKYLQGDARVFGRPWKLLWWSGVSGAINAFVAA